MRSETVSPFFLLTNLDDQLYNDDDGRGAFCCRVAGKAAGRSIPGGKRGARPRVTAPLTERLAECHTIRHWVEKSCPLERLASERVSVM